MTLEDVIAQLKYAPMAVWGSAVNLNDPILYVYMRDEGGISRVQTVKVPEEDRDRLKGEIDDFIKATNLLLS